MAGIDAIGAIKKKFIPDTNPSINKGQQHEGAFLAKVITSDDFSRKGEVLGWNNGNVPMTGLPT